MACNKDHSDIQSIMGNLPTDQGRIGRHKCAACAYQKGYSDGYKLEEHINLENIINDLENSQAQYQRHKSPHAAYAQGYLDGVNKYYKEKNC